MGIDTARKDSDDLDASRQDPLLDTYKVLTGRREQSQLKNKKGKKRYVYEI